MNDGQGSTDELEQGVHAAIVYAEAHWDSLAGRACQPLERVRVRSGSGTSATAAGTGTRPSGSELLRRFRARFPMLDESSWVHN